MLDDQLRPALGVQRADLAEVGTKLDRSGLKVLVELQLPEFQIPNPNQHGSTGLSSLAHEQHPKQPRRSGRNRVWQAKLLTENSGRYRQAGSY